MQNSNVNEIQESINEKEVVRNSTGKSACRYYERTESILAKYYAPPWLAPHWSIRWLHTAQAGYQERRGRTGCKPLISGTIISVIGTVVDLRIALRHAQRANETRFC